MEKSIDWDAINHGWQESGLSQQVYCKKQTVDYARFCSWRSNQIQQGKQSSMRYKSKVIGKAKGKTEIKPLDFIPLDLKRSQSQEKRIRFIELDLPHGIVMRIPVNEFS